MAEEQAPRVSKYQKFDVQRIHRSRILTAPYNPRSISRDNQMRLAQKLEEVGLIETLVWNRRTGTLVSGHQRLTILDVLEGTEDYELDVAVVDLSGKQEREMNVFLNNQSVQGTWDRDALAQLLRECDADYEAMGFDIRDMQLLLPDVYDEITAAAELSEEGADVLELLRYEEHLDAEKREREREQRRALKAEEAITITAVFANSRERDRFLGELGFDTSRYIDGRRLATLLGLGDLRVTRTRPGDEAALPSPPPLPPASAPRSTGDESADAASWEAASSVDQSEAASSTDPTAP
jgi:hypothetical protein